MVNVSLEAKTRAPAHAANHAVKPRLRGIPDIVAVMVALPAVLSLVAHARLGASTLAATVYGACLVMLFATSATYHTFMWSPAVRMVLRRFDHSMVYVLIAGTYTPFCLLALEPTRGTPMLLAVWVMTILGAVKSFVWEKAPRTLNTAIYITMGWMVAFLLPSLYRSLGWVGTALILAGGVLYTVGAVIYARRTPNPYPTTFGYHEVFHVFVIAAAACHFVALWGLVG